MIISTLRVGPSGPLFLFWPSEPHASGGGKRQDKRAVDSPTFDARFVVETGLAAEIAGLAEPVLASLGFRLVRVMLSQRDGMTVQIMAERANGTIAIEDCALISRQLSPVLDLHDPLPGHYRLEVSSPGIDRPLVRPSDFRDWTGHEARIEMQEKIEGRKRFRGMLEGIEGDKVLIGMACEGGGRQVIGLPIARLAEARLVLTDELIRETLRRAKRENAQRAGMPRMAD